ncbi:hypothetical protein ACFP1I_29500 [Dyadobacter subterraneus]|uniref:HEPN domain-containing protein n=1 Tax=Dyadobacter subterraneus TaxID=2773304 RepID=A0ABR9WM86_9BACT|nr:hypothetical protein [Dyadobacter subterraneus]
MSSKSHKGAHIKFNELFIFTREFTKEMNTILVATFNQRQMGDYDIDSEINNEEALETLNKARHFVNTVIHYLKNNGYLE